MVRSSIYRLPSITPSQASPRSPIRHCTVLLYYTNRVRHPRYIILIFIYIYIYISSTLPLFYHQYLLTNRGMELLLPQIRMSGVEMFPAPFLPTYDSFDQQKTMDTSERAILNLKEAGLAAVLHVPSQESYEARVGSYWSLTSRLRPWAFVQPRNAEELARAVKALVRTHGCPFAVRRLVSISLMFSSQSWKHPLSAFNLYLFNMIRLTRNGSLVEVTCAGLEPAT